VDNDLAKLRIDKSDRASRHERPVWPWILAVLLIGGSAVGGWQWKRSAARPTVTTIRVRVPEGLAAETNRVLLNATGYVIAAHKIQLASKVSGRVAWIGVEMGDRIEAGQVLVKLEDAEFKARVVQEQGRLENAKAQLAQLEAGSRPQEIAAAAAAVEKAKAELENADANYKRMKELEGTKSISRQQMDDARATLRSRMADLDAQIQQHEMMKVGPRQEEIDAARATVRMLEGGLALAQVDLDNTQIRSAIAATVLARNVEVGEFVTTGFVGDRGAKGYVVSIADLNDLRVELDVSQNDFAKVLPGQPCWIVTDVYPDRRYAGVVDLISPEANRQKATIQVRVKVSNPDDRLRPDMNATVSFLAPDGASARPSTTSTTGERPAIRVPATAVRDGSVFVVEDDKAVARRVTVGSRMNSEIEVRDGLIGGEDLIIDPPATLADGEAVVIRAKE
jgi:HlyD family secretion protein